MRRNDGIRGFRNCGRYEIRHVFSELAGIQRFDQGGFIDRQIPRKVKEDSSLFHHAEGILADHAVRGVIEGHMDRDEVAFLIDIRHILHVLDAAGQVPGRFQ